MDPVVSSEGGPAEQPPDHPAPDSKKTPQAGGGGRGPRSTPFLALEDVKRILFLAVPAMLAFLTQTLVNIVDTYFIGRLPEPERSDGQAMLAFALALVWAIGGFFSAISVGTQALVGRREGSAERKEAGGVLLNAVGLGTVASVVAAILAWLAMPVLFEFVSDDPSFVELGTVYTRWRFVGLVSMVLTAAYKAFYDGTGRTYVHFVAAVVMNIVNVILCWMLILGNAGMPEMGVEGAGIAAAIASWIGLAVMVGFSVRRIDARRYHPYRLAALSKDVLRDLTKLSVPSGVATTVVMTGFILFIQIVHIFDARHLAAGGTESIYGAATTIIIEVLSLTFFACMAFGVATATLVSQQLGAGNPDAAERYAWSSVKIGIIAFGLLGALEASFPEACIRFFNDSDAVVEVGVSSMRMMGACGPIIACGMILTQALFGAGNPRFVMLTELVLHFGCLIPLAYLLGIVLDGGLLGVWSSATTYVVLLTAIMVWKFRQGTWKSIEL